MPADRLAAFAEAAEVAHFQIGVIGVSLHCPYGPALRDFCSLYDDCRVEVPPPDAIRVDVKPTRLGRMKRRRYEVWADDEHRFTVWNNPSVLPHIEWAINWHIMLYQPRYYQIHAGVVECDGQGVILPAGPGCGKTTLTAGLVRSGWRYLSDEFALIDPDDLRLRAYPKALCVKEGSFAVLDAMGLRAARRRDYQKGQKGRVTFVKPSELNPSAIGGRCPVRFVMFPKFEAARSPRVREMSRAEAVLRLNEVSFNFTKYRAAGVQIMADIVREARVFELDAGPVDETVELVRSVVRG